MKLTVRRMLREGAARLDPGRKGEARGSQLEGDRSAATTGHRRWPSSKQGKNSRWARKGGCIGASMSRESWSNNVDDNEGGTLRAGRQQVGTTGGGKAAALHETEQGGSRGE